MKGPCSNEAGILMYYEIMALKAQNPGTTVVWDRAAAVKYLTYGGGNQWVSYDDADTFKQKREFQDKMGLGGALIWASDAGECLTLIACPWDWPFSLDDDDYTAMSGLIGEPVGSIKHPVGDLLQFARTPENTANYLASSSAKECYIETAYKLGRCVNMNEDYTKLQCVKSGDVVVGIAHGTAVPSKMVCPVCQRF
jgi:chitinase